MNTGGPSGTRTRDLRIKRPSASTHAEPVNKARGEFQSSTKSTGEPPGNERATKPAILGPGAHVRITRGMAKGIVGTVLSRWPTTFGGEAQWVVESGDIARRRVIRADYLEVVG